jgi:hypothetical protein
LSPGPAQLKTLIFGASEPQEYSTLNCSGCEPAIRMAAPASSPQTRGEGFSGTLCYMRMTQKIA